MPEITAKLRDKIEKLLRLSSSPNPHEADRAREEAERLMNRHGLTYADFEKDSVLIVEVAKTNRDVNLAYIVGVSRRCGARINGRGELAFVGKHTAAVSAKALYEYLVKEVEKTCYVDEPGRAIWRRLYWGGFISSIRNRLRDAEIWKPPPPQFENGDPNHIGKVDVTTSDDSEVVEFAVQNQDGYEQFCKRAYEAGLKFGREIQIPDDGYRTGIRPDRTLGEKETA